MKILEIEELLPRLNENAKDVDSWEEEFTRLMRLANLTSASTIHSWALECVEGELRGVLQDLVQVNNEEERYPTIKEMKEALEEALEITPQMKCKILQRLKIQKGETIKNFNWRYKKLYNNLPNQYKDFITVDDYTESIIYRPFARAQVITQQCDTLEEAFSEAELAERAENFENSRNTDTVLATVYYKKNNSLSSKHPYKLFRKNYMNPQGSHEDISKIGRTQDQQKSQTKSSIGYGRLKCYKCNLMGHTMKQCPYSYKELAKMEEEGKLKNSSEPLNLESPEEIVAAAARRQKKSERTLPYSKLQKQTKSLKENPVPINLPSGYNKEQNMNMNNTNQKDLVMEDIEQEDHQETEKLNEIDISVIAQPSIKKSKENSRKERKEDINKEKPVYKKDDKDSSKMLPSAEIENQQKIKKELNVKQKPKEKHIQMIQQQKPYNINNDLNQLTPNITFSQLLDL
ncbi:hypothetical protein PIROE2DRAFT_19314, partial [Piromyces sp. E2]